MDAFPLAPRANLSYYRKLAKDLLGAWRSTDDGAVALWARRWLERLQNLHGAPLGLRPLDGEVQRAVLLAREESRGKVALAQAQHVVARLHGFESWPRFSRHLEAIERRTTAEARFEAAADAVVSGELPRLRELLTDSPELIRLRSSRRHGSTLLHYVAANGIEDFRQRTPPNILEVASLLLAAGAEVDASNGDRGDGTALGLVATSAHPREAGLQLPLMELLLAAGADVNGLPGGWSPMRAALANGCPEAAQWLAAHGARQDVVTAAGMGHLDVLQRLLEVEVPPAELEKAFVFACGCGQTAAARLLLDQGVDVGAVDGQTGLHLACHSAHLETVRFLLSRQAPLEVKNRFGGTVLEQALWSALHNPERDYLPIIDELLRAGAVVDPGRRTGLPAVDALLASARR